ncbi:MAG: DUF6498-containing protein [Xanthomonadales bacterium]|nr:DUF6498-containing protein [Xanthomonadales bacterium]
MPPLLLANGLTLLIAELKDFGPLELLWPFWFQNVWIGLASAQRIRSLRDYSTAGLRINDRPVAPSPELPRRLAWFFLLHYGFFHLGYLVFLVALTYGSAPDGTIEVTEAESGERHEVFLGHPDGLDWLGVGLLALVFRWTAGREARELGPGRRPPNIGALMFLPYLRVVPMHLAIILALLLGAGATIWLFVALKTVAEAATLHLARKIEGG